MSAFDEVAIRIGRRLASEAVWHGGRCSWIGPVPATVDGAQVIDFRPLDADLYGGTSGVGLVLAEVASATGDAACRRAAVGAVRHALGAVAAVPPHDALGLYTGLPGVALAALRCGHLLGEDGFVEDARRLLDRLARQEDGSDDLIAGRAGAIVGAVALGSGLADASGAQVARDAAEHLIAAAGIAGGWTWAARGAASGLLPTGVSHGASGVGYAMLELWAATGDERYRHAAAQAVDNESAYFDEIAGNWPRTGGGGGHQPWTAAAVSHVHWCHGAPGIGLAHHRAWVLTGDEARRSAAAVALSTTARWVRAAVATGRATFCLCHGLAGNAEIMADCAAAGGDRAPELRALAMTVAEHGLAECGNGERAWPCGLPGGESPGLMTGLAGIARFYLRITRPELPSVLLVHPGPGWTA